MLYREAGQFKSTYAADSAIMPIRQDRIGLALERFSLGEHTDDTAVLAVMRN